MSSLIQPPQPTSGAASPARVSAARRVRPQSATPAESTPPVSLDTVPSAPPAEVLSQIRAAAGRYESLRAEGHEVRYSHEAGSGQPTITLHDRTGAMIKSLSPSEALELAAAPAPAPPGRKG